LITIGDYAPIPTAADHVPFSINIGTVSPATSQNLLNIFRESMVTNPSGHRHIIAYSALVLSALSFGSNWIVGRGLAEDIPPMATSFWRWTVAFIGLLPFAIKPMLRDAAEIRRAWRIIVLLSLLGVGLFQALAYWGLQFTSATNGALLNSSVPILVVILSTLFFGAKLTWPIAIGVTVSMIGVVTIIMRGDLEVLLNLRVNVGDLMILVAMVIWALYSIGLRWRPANLHRLSFLGASFGLGVLITGVLFLIEWLLGYRGNYRGEFPSLVAYFCWNIGVDSIGANRAGVFAHLIPVFAAILAMIFLGERPQTYHFAGFALVLLGIWLSNRSRAPVS
jgi:drug/metabolite transporter (DMT)-like permease